MSDKQQVRIEITADGEIHVKTLGIKGEACLDYVEIMERLLDAETTESSFTEEYYETAAVQTKNIEKEWLKGE